MPTNLGTHRINSQCDRSAPAALEQASDARTDNVQRTDNVRSVPFRLLVQRAFSADLQLSHVERAVLAWLADRADADGRAWPSLDEGAARCGLAVRSVRRVLARLEARGMLVRHHAKRGERSPLGWALGRAATIVQLVGLQAGPIPAIGPIDVARAFRAGDPLTTLQRVVLALVAAFCGLSGARACFAGYAHLARLAGASERALGAAVRALVRDGYLVAERVAPGGELPSGERARDWRIVLQLGASYPDRRASTPGPTVRATRTDVPKILAMDRDPTRHPLGHPPPDIAGLVEAYRRAVNADPGPDAARVLADRLADGYTSRELASAAWAIAADPWRMAVAGRRTVRAALGTAAKVRDWLDRAQLAAPEPAPTREELRREAEALAARRAADEAGQADARARLASLTGGLVARLSRGGSW